MLSIFPLSLIHFINIYGVLKISVTYFLTFISFCNFSVWVNKNKIKLNIWHPDLIGSWFLNLLFAFWEVNISEGGVEALRLALTTQWGSDESVPSRPFPSPRQHIPSLTHCTDIRIKSSGGFAPTTPNSNTPTQKYISHSATLAGLSFFCPAQVLSSRHSDGPYCTARQKKRQPSLWATDRPCLGWKDFDGAKQGWGFAAQRS